MKRFLLLATAVAFLLAPRLAAAQQAGEDGLGGIAERAQEAVERSGIEPALESIASASLPELQDALDQLATTLTVLAARIASDPELRESALRAAGGLVGVAQVAIEEQSDAIQEALRKLAERLEAMPAPRLSVPAS